MYLQANYANGLYSYILHLSTSRGKQTCEIPLLKKSRYIVCGCFSLVEQSIGVGPVCRERRPQPTVQLVSHV